MLPHQIFNINRYCLYCSNSKCELNPNRIMFYEFQCSCGEKYSLLLLGGFKYFSLTCNDYCISYIIEDTVKYFSVRFAGKDVKVLPYFNLDISNKQKMYDKIKTYLTFQ